MNWLCEHIYNSKLLNQTNKNKIKANGQHPWTCWVKELQIKMAKSLVAELLRKLNKLFYATFCHLPQRDGNCHYQKQRQQPFNGLFSRITWVSRYQKGKTNLDFTGARDSEWQWHQLGHMQVCNSLQTDNHANTPHSFFTGRMPFLSPNQQRQSTEGIKLSLSLDIKSTTCLHVRKLPGTKLHRWVNLHTEGFFATTSVQNHSAV